MKVRYRVVLFGVLVAGCLQKLPEERNRQLQSSEPLPDITADLSMSGVPSLGQVVELTFSSKFYLNAKNATMEIFLPEGFTLVDGNLTFNGDVSRGEKVQIKSLVKAIKTGMWVIRAEVGNYNWDSLYINVSESSGQVSQLPFDYPRHAKHNLTDRIGTQIIPPSNRKDDG